MVQRNSQSFLQMLEDVRRELQIERAAHHADFVLEDDCNDEHARPSVMGPRHEVCWIWGDDIASEQDAALAGSGPTLLPHSRSAPLRPQSTLCFLIPRCQPTAWSWR